ncbi:MAG: glycosyltransferase [Sedimentisphaerales bacterium]|nr:glycosyltransferase [Sedimentisphaerales bacterium]
MARLFWQNANAYGTLVANLNGRFRGLSSREETAFVDLGNVDLSRNSIAKVLIVLAVLTIAVGTWTHWSDFGATVDVLQAYLAGRIYTVIALGLTAINVAAFFWRVALAIQYSPEKSCTDDQLATCTVIVPAYNEGRQVLRTLRSIARSDYPMEKLEIIAIDDGSKDDTWYWIEKAARGLNGRIRTIRLPQNGGKRHALYEGFKKSSGQILVTIDSDSLIEPCTLRKLVSPFYFDEHIGAVAGSVRVLNQHEGVIPRMLEISFAYSFEFIRASQSMVGCVLCTPGALAAYRRQPLMSVLDKWLQQTFFGYSANIGEDRALTNWILRTGSLVTFQSNAIVYTNVPVRYDGLCRMFMRWARSNVRETIAMGAFIFDKFRQGSALGARINFILSCINLVVPQILLVGMLFCILWQPEVFLTQVLFGAVLTACIPAAFYMLRRNDSNALWAFAHNLFWIVALSWITPYSIFTCHKDSWLTREIGHPETPVPPAVDVPCITRPAA